MPWSPLLYEKEILTEIQEKQKNNLISVDTLTLIIMRTTKLVGPKGIKNTIKALETLGYIKLRPDGWFDVNTMLIEKRLFDLEKGSE
jgi:hypothetical protein